MFAPQVAGLCFGARGRCREGLAGAEDNPSAEPAVFSAPGMMGAEMAGGRELLARTPICIASLIQQTTPWSIVQSQATLPTGWQG